MYSPAVLVFLFSCVALGATETSTELVAEEKVVTHSAAMEAPILLAVTACTTGSVLMVLLPTVIYQTLKAMSLFAANPRQVLHALELAGTFTCTWPLRPNAGRREILLRGVRWAFAMLSVTLLLVSLALAVYHFWDDVYTLVKTVTELMALLEAFLDLVLCKLKSKQLQTLIGRIEAFLAVADARECDALQGYVDRYKKYFATIGMAHVVTGVAFSLVPLFSEQPLPADGWIPFSVEPAASYCAVYVLQVYCIFHTAVCTGVDFTIALLFGYAAAKLDVLRTRLREASDYEALVGCAREHQEIIRFVETTQATVKTLLLKTNATMGSAVIFAAFPLIQNHSLAVVSQFLPLLIADCGRLHVICWPADDLRESSSRFAESIIDAQWIGKPRKFATAAIIMMQRSQRTFIIKMTDLLPAVSLEYFSKFLTTVLSYFMAMRTVIET